jgi:hypothetical protein
VSDLITDRAEAMLVEDSAPVSRKVMAISTTPSAPARSGEKIPCSWCGAYSVPGPGCDSCGSPLSF